MTAVVAVAAGVFFFFALAKSKPDFAEAFAVYPPPKANGAEAGVQTGAGVQASGEAGDSEQAAAGEAAGGINADGAEGIASPDAEERAGASAPEGDGSDGGASADGDTQ